MKHILTNGWNFKKIRTGDKYYRLWFNLECILLAVTILLLILRLSIPDIGNYLLQALTVTILTFLLATAVIFVIRIVKTKIVDWAHIIVFAAFLLIVWNKIDDYGGLYAIFSAT